MQAITTKYLPATNHKPARVKATATAGSVLVSYDSALRDDDAHKEAALALCRKFGWEGSLVMGTTHNGDNVWVFIPSVRDIIYAHGKEEASHASK